MASADWSWQKASHVTCGWENQRKICHAGFGLIDWLTLNLAEEDPFFCLNASCVTSVPFYFRLAHQGCHHLQSPHHHHHHHSPSCWQLSIINANELLPPTFPLSLWMLLTFPQQSEVYTLTHFIKWSIIYVRNFVLLPAKRDSWYAYQKMPRWKVHFF